MRRRLGRDALKKRGGVHGFMRENVRFQARSGDAARRPMNLFDTATEREYSLAEALRCSRARLSYRDRMETEYPDADMASLRGVAAEVLAITEREPLDRDQPGAVHGLD
jgi:hypothetical protein